MRKQQEGFRSAPHSPVLDALMSQLHSFKSSCSADVRVATIRRVMDDPLAAYIDPLQQRQAQGEGLPH